MFMCRIAAVAFLAVNLASCGTYVPDIQEIPGDRAGGQSLVTAIVRNIKCEVQDALYDIYRIEKSTFFDKWGVQINLDLTIVETGAVNPNVNWMPPSPASAVLGLGAGLNLSSEATRTDKLGMFYTVAELKRLGPCLPEARGGPFILQSNLKLNEWLIDVVTATKTGGIDIDQDVASGAFKDGVLSHEVKFVVATGGDFSPTLTLTRVTINPDGKIFTANRQRSHDLIITLGPTELKDKGGRRGPSRIAADAALASQIGVSVSNALRNTTRP
jgi:hypothetical protein